MESKNVQLPLKNILLKKHSLTTQVLRKKNSKVNQLN
jgi:hypothetical protein